MPESFTKKRAREKPENECVPKGVLDLRKNRGHALGNAHILGVVTGFMDAESLLRFARCCGYMWKTITAFPLLAGLRLFECVVPFIEGGEPEWLDSRFRNVLSCPMTLARLLVMGDIATHGREGRLRPDVAFLHQQSPVACAATPISLSNRVLFSCPKDVSPHSAGAVWLVLPKGCTKASQCTSKADRSVQWTFMNAIKIDSPAMQLTAALVDMMRIPHSVRDNDAGGKSIVVLRTLHPSVPFPVLWTSHGIHNLVEAVKVHGVNNRVYATMGADMWDLWNYCRGVDVRVPPTRFKAEYDANVDTTPDSEASASASAGAGAGAGVEVSGDVPIFDTGPLSAQVGHKACGGDRGGTKSGDKDASYEDRRARYFQSMVKQFVRDGWLHSVWEQLVQTPCQRVRWQVGVACERHLVAKAEALKRKAELDVVLAAKHQALTENRKQTLPILSEALAAIGIPGMTGKLQNGQHVVFPGDVEAALDKYFRHKSVVVNPTRHSFIINRRGKLVDACRRSLSHFMSKIPESSRLCAAYPREWAAYLDRPSNSICSVSDRRLKAVAFIEELDAKYKSQTVAVQADAHVGTGGGSSSGAGGGGGGSSSGGSSSGGSSSGAGGGGGSSGVVDPKAAEEAEFWQLALEMDGEEYFNSASPFDDFD